MKRDISPYTLSLLVSLGMFGYAAYRDFGNQPHALGFLAIGAAVFTFAGLLARKVNLP